VHILYSLLHARQEKGMPAGQGYDATRSRVEREKRGSVTVVYRTAKSGIHPVFGQESLPHTSNLDQTIQYDSVTTFILGANQEK
jgi:hypothetical protein